MTDGAFDFEVVVVGAGPAGLAAACVAAESGCRVGLVDDTPWLGGQIWRGQAPRASLPQARYWFERFRHSGATLLAQTSVLAAPAPGLLLAEQNQAGAGHTTVVPPSPSPLQKGRGLGRGVPLSSPSCGALDNHPCQIRWQRLVLATGARELFLPFPGWTLPGVMGPGGLQALVKHGWPIQGQRVLLAGSSPLLLAVAAGLRKHCAQIVSVVEQAPWPRLWRFGCGLWSHPAKLIQAAQLKLSLFNVPYRYGAWPLSAEPEASGLRVTLTDGKRTWSQSCDVFACGFGLVPNVELPLVLGCELSGAFVQVDRFQATTAPKVYCAGEPTGIGGADCALVEGQIAGYAAAGYARRAEALFPLRATWHQFRNAMAVAFSLRDDLKSLASNETVACRCEDVTLGQIRRFGSWREAKLQSRCGMGACQGRVCGAAAKVILGWDAESVRPPVLPARVRSLISQPKPSPPSVQEGDQEALRSLPSPVESSAFPHPATAVPAASLINMNLNQPPLDA